jgi:hypothetical protein
VIDRRAVGTRDPEPDATCHCGAVRIFVRRMPRSVTSCNCSICRRYAALWAYYQPSSVRIEAPGNGLQRYSWNRRIRNYHRCRECGCITHYARADGRPGGAVAVNARLFEPDAMQKVRVRNFDGADTWKYLSS